MAKSSEFHPAARHELREAVLRYAHVDETLGADFARCVFKRIDQFEQVQLAGFPSDFETRTVLIRRLPYQVVFKNYPQNVWIVAIARTARRPEYWHPRIDDHSEDQP